MLSYGKPLSLSYLRNSTLTNAEVMKEALVGHRLSYPIQRVESNHDSIGCKIHRDKDIKDVHHQNDDRIFEEFGGVLRKLYFTM